MADGQYLTNQLLIAMPSLGDPNFSHTVALVCEHTERGALGIVLRGALDGLQAGSTGLALAVLAGWGLLAVAVAARTFRWEP